MDNSDKGGKTFGALMLGALAGAAAVFLSDKKNRDKVKGHWNNLKEEGQNRLGQVADKVEEVKEKGKQKLDTELEKTQQKLRDANEENSLTKGQQSS